MNVLHAGDRSRVGDTAADLQHTKKVEQQRAGGVAGRATPSGSRSRHDDQHL